MENIIGLRIRNRRIRIEKTQEELGALVHVKKQTISKWEKGINIPDAETLKNLSDILECSVDYLVGKTDIPNSYHHIYNDDEAGKIELDYPYRLTPDEVKEMVETLKKYHFDIDALIKDMREKENKDK